MNGSAAAFSGVFAIEAYVVLSHRQPQTNAVLARKCWGAPPALADEMVDGREQRSLRGGRHRYKPTQWSRAVLITDGDPAW